MSNLFRRLKLFVFVVLWVTLFVFLLIDKSILEFLSTTLSEHPVAAPFVFFLMQIILAAFFLPCSPLTVLAGMLWSFERAIVYSMLATFLATIFTFFLGRFVIQDWIKKNLKGQLQQGFLKIVSRYSWKAVMIAQINPLFPGSSLGYLFGVTSISASVFSIGIILGIIPLQIILVGAGTLVQTVSSGYWSIWTLLSIVFVSFLVLFARNIIQRILAWFRINY